MSSSFKHLKIALVCNQDNNAFKFATWLREHNNHVHLYLLGRENQRSLPENLDLNLVNNYPDWIRKYKLGPIKGLLFPDKILIKRIHNQYDVVISFGIRGLYASRFFKHIPRIHYCLGSEVNELPFWSASSPRFFISKWVSMFLLRNSLKGVHRIYMCFEKSMLAAKKLNIHGKTEVIGFPEDMEKNRRIVNQDLLKQLNGQYSQYRRVFLWLSRVNFLNRESPEYKATDYILRAVRRLKEMRGDFVVLMGNHGFDAHAFRALALQYKIEDCFQWVEHMPFWKLVTYLSMDNAVVLDNFDRQSGTLSGMAREALSMGAVLIKYINNDLIKLGYGTDYPFEIVSDSKTLSGTMEKLLEMDNKAFNQLKAEYREWTRHHLHYTQRIGQFVDSIEKVVLFYASLGHSAFRS